MRYPLLITACTFTLTGLTACHQQGPVEKTGSSLDRAGQKVHDTLDPPHGPAQATGRKLDRALGN